MLLAPITMFLFLLFFLKKKKRKAAEDTANEKELRRTTCQKYVKNIIKQWLNFNYGNPATNILVVPTLFFNWILCFWAGSKASETHFILKQVVAPKTATRRRTRHTSLRVRGRVKNSLDSSPSNISKVFLVPKLEPTLKCEIVWRQERLECKDKFLKPLHQHLVLLLNYKIYEIKICQI